MGILNSFFPPVDVALQLEPEELARPLLECLAELDRHGDHGQLQRHNFLLPHTFEGYCDRGKYNEIAKATAEAWFWLEKEGLLVPKPGQDRDWVFITRRGRKFLAVGDTKTFKGASLLPHETLDPQLAAKVSPPFMRGDYDSSVFEAFKEVEIRVRKLSQLSPDDLGVNLMRKAFKPGEGSLVDKGQTRGEQQGIADLFAGAIGSFKNPSSHRDVDFEEPSEAVELILLADLLIRIAERRQPQKQ